MVARVRNAPRHTDRLNTVLIENVPGRGRAGPLSPGSLQTSVVCLSAYLSRIMEYSQRAREVQVQ